MRFLLICFGLMFLFNIRLFAFAPEIQEIVDRGKLRIAMIQSDEFPFIFTDSEGKLRGCDVDLSEQIAQALGVKTEYIRTYSSFDTVLDGIAKNEADIAVSFISRTLERAKSSYFSTPYIIGRLGLAVNRKILAQKDRNVSVIQYFNQEKLKIGTIAGSAYSSLAKEIFPGAEIIPIQLRSEGFNQVFSGELAAFFTYEFDIDHAILNNPHQSIFIQTILFKDLEDFICIAVPPNKPYILYFLNSFLMIESQNLTSEKLFKRYHDYRPKEVTYSNQN